MLLVPEYLIISLTWSDSCRTHTRVTYLSMASNSWHEPNEPVVIFYTPHVGWIIPT